MAPQIVKVYGFVQTDANQNAPNADVTVTCLDNDKQAYGITNSGNDQGFYYIEVDCPSDGSIKVDASFNGTTGSASGTAFNGSVAIMVKLSPKPDSIVPLTLSFTSPTEADGSTINRGWAFVNASIDSISPDSVKFYWHGTNYSIYDDSLVLALNFDNNAAIGETSTKIVDISKYGNNGTCSGTSCPAWTPSSESGGAVRFDGVNDYYTISDSQSTQVPRTIEFWANVARTGHDNGLIDKYSSGNGYLMYFTGANLFRVVINGTSYINYGMGAYMDTWTHYAVTFDKGSCALYINGKMVKNDSTCQGPPTAVSAPLYLGLENEWTGTRFNGSLDSFRMYSRVLSSNEISIQYKTDFVKYNGTKWGFYGNMTGLKDGVYSFSGWANDTSGNIGKTDGGNIRSINVIVPKWYDYFEDFTAEYLVDHPLLHVGIDSFDAITNSSTFLDLGGSGSVYVPNVPGTNKVNNYSVFLVVKPSSGPTHDQTLLKIGLSNSSLDADSEYAIGIHDTGQVYTVIGNGKTSSRTDYGLYLKFGSWNSFACGINASNILWCASPENAYYKGARSISYSNLGDSILIGSSKQGSGGFNGSVKYAYLANGTMTPDEIKTASYNNRTTDYLESYCLDSVFSSMWIARDGVFMGTMGNVLYKGVDGDSSFAPVYTFASVPLNDSVRALFLAQDSKNNTYVSFAYDGGRLWESKANANGSYNLTNFKNVLTMSCKNGVVWDLKNFQELKNGNILVGQYAQTANMFDNCAVIYETDNNGDTWMVSYNDNISSAGKNYTSPARHVHFVQQDPYTGYVYASLGDDQTTRKLIRSTDNGTTWTLLNYGLNDGFSWQPTSVVFTPDYRVYGEDWGIASTSRIFRTSDDVNYYPVFNNDSAVEGAWYWASKDSKGIMYFGNDEVSAFEGNKTVSKGDEVIVASADNGTSWYYVMRNGSSFQEYTDNPSDLNNNNYFYLSGNSGDSSCRIRKVSRTLPIAEYLFKEGNGTILHDAAGGKDGSLFNGNWVAEETDVHLIENKDYSLIRGTGVFQLNSPDYWFATIHAFYNITEVTTTTTTTTITSTTTTTTSTTSTAGTTTTTTVAGGCSGSLSDSCDAFSGNESGCNGHYVYHSGIDSYGQCKYANGTCYEYQACIGTGGNNTTTTTVSTTTTSSTVSSTTSSTEPATTTSSTTTTTETPTTTTTENTSTTTPPAPTTTAPTATTVPATTSTTVPETTTTAPATTTSTEITSTTTMPSTTTSTGITSTTVPETTTSTTETTPTTSPVHGSTSHSASYTSEGTGLLIQSITTQSTTTPSTQPEKTMEDRLKEIASSVTNNRCESQIICNGWSDCSGGFQKRTCRDVAGCTTDTTEVRACQTTTGNGQTPENVTYRPTGGAGNASNNGSGIPAAVGLFTGLNIGVNEMAGAVLILVIAVLAIYALRGKKGGKSLQNLE